MKQRFYYFLYRIIKLSTFLIPLYSAFQLIEHFSSPKYVVVSFLIIYFILLFLLTEKLDMFYMTKIEAKEFEKLIFTTFTKVRKIEEFKYEVNTCNRTAIYEFNIYRIGRQRNDNIFNLFVSIDDDIDNELLRLCKIHYSVKKINNSLLIPIYIDSYFFKSIQKDLNKSIIEIPKTIKNFNFYLDKKIAKIHSKNIKNSTRISFTKKLNIPLEFGIKNWVEYISNQTQLEDLISLYNKSDLTEDKQFLFEIILDRLEKDSQKKALPDDFLDCIKNKIQKEKTLHYSTLQTWMKNNSNISSAIHKIYYS